MSDKKRHPFTESSTIPSLETFNHVRHLLAQLGAPRDQVNKLHPAIIGFIADHLQQIENYKRMITKQGNKLQEMEFDVIRLRGQRNALRSALIKNNEQDPMLGYASDHMLEAITETHQRTIPDPDKPDSDDPGADAGSDALERK